MTTTVSVSVNGNYKRLVQIGTDKPVWVSGAGSPTPVSQTFNVAGDVGVTVGPEKTATPDIGDQPDDATARQAGNAPDEEAETSDNSDLDNGNEDDGSEDGENEGD